MFFQLPKPNSKDVNMDKIVQALIGDKRQEILDFTTKVSEHEYIYWDKVRHKRPSPEGITKETSWSIVKFFRRQKAIKTVIRSEDGRPFTWSKLGYFEELEHKLDMNTGGELFIGGADIDKASKQRLITRGIIEEAIASSQLEGANTSRMAAKKMLREGRKPKNRSEQMIVNNHASMKAIEEEYSDRKMSMDLLLELHGLIAIDTLDDQGEEPRLRKKGEAICVTDKSTGLIYYQGPDMDFVTKELSKFVDFANDNLGSETFIHPIVKAIMIHFWIGYLHPFTDGNGRLARLLFYWYLLKKGYWAFAYLPISKVIKKSPIQYLMAYVYSEQDENDLTYFIDYNFKKINMALKDFIDYLNDQSKDNLQMKKTSENKYNLNMRQVQLLQYLYGDPDGRTNLKAHVNINRVTKATASTDLKDLLKKRFLSSKKQGTFVYYYGTKKIKELF